MSPNLIGDNTFVLFRRSHICVLIKRLLTSLFKERRINICIIIIKLSLMKLKKIIFHVMLLIPTFCWKRFLAFMFFILNCTKTLEGFIYHHLSVHKQTEFRWDYKATQGRVFWMMDMDARPSINMLFFLQEPLIFAWRSSLLSLLVVVCGTKCQYCFRVF